MTEYEKLLAGLQYVGNDPELLAMQAEGRAAKSELDNISPTDMQSWMKGLTKVFGPMAGPNLVRPPFTISFGRHVSFGEWCFVNSGATFLDDGPITFGSRIAVGPNVQFITATHPVRAEERFVEQPESFPPFDVINIAKPITIGDFTWIGAGAIIMPGVKIGERAVVGAGSVVTKDVPDGMIVAGNPARILRHVDDQNA